MNAMSPATVYSIDSSALIHGWRRAYPPRNFAPFWTRVEALIGQRRLRASVEVFNELERKDDDIYKWCKARRADFFVEIDDGIQEHLRHIMGAYPRLTDTSTGRSGGDPFVIALARNYNPPLTVVSEENPGKKNSPKIPDVCRLEGILCIRLVELIQELDWRF